MNFIYAGGGALLCSLVIFIVMRGRFSASSVREKVLSYLFSVLLGFLCGWIIPDRVSTFTGILRVVLMLAVLTASAYTDRHSKKIPNLCPIILLCGYALVSLFVFFDGLEAGLQTLLGGLVSGGIILILLLLCRVVSRGGIGYGDIKLLSAAGCLFGIYGVFSILLFGELSAVLFVAYKMIRREMTKKDNLALAPFLMFGYAVTLWLGQF